MRRLRVFQVFSVYRHRPLIINLFPPPPLNGSAAIPQSRPEKLRAIQRRNKLFRDYESRLITLETVP